MTNNYRSLEQLADLYNKYKSYIYSCVDGVYLINENGRFMEVNPSGCQMLGYNKDELLGMSIMEITDQSNLDPSLAHFSELKLHGKSSKKLSLIKKDGSKITVENNAAKVANGYIGFVRDITERTKLENELCRYKEQLELMVAERTKELQQEIEERKKIQRELQLKSIFLDAANDTILAHDLAGNFIYANEKAYKTMGYNKDDFMSLNLSDINSHKFAEMITARVNILLEKGQIAFEAEHRCVNGETIPVEVNAKILHMENEPIILSVSRDITQRRQMEKETAKLARLSAVAEMAATVAHEIRNPMSAIRGLLEILKTKADGTNFRGHFDLMIGELDRCNAIITDYFSLAKDNKSIKQMNNINTVIKTLLPLIKTKAILAEKHISLKLGEIPNHLLDEKEIRQLILNLILNGLEAMDPQGTLTIGTYMCDQDIVLEIQDEGSGIDPTIVDKLGTPFLTTKDQGTGLGLSVCYNITKRHNANIKFETSPKGTTFKVVFRPDAV
jgi:PAS domain S-box-containing protein